MSKENKIIFLIVFSFFSLKIFANETPVARIATESDQVILVGSTFDLDATISSDPDAGDSLYYSWRLVSPAESEASLSTPSPSSPSFVPDRPGLYVVELKVNDGKVESPPVYLMVSAVTPFGNSILAKDDYTPSVLCSFSLGRIGCLNIQKTFMATPGDYSLNIVNKSADDIILTLNSVELTLPSSLKKESSFTLPVTLLSQNTLNIDVRGGMGSAVSVEIVESMLPQASNNSPQVADLSLNSNSITRMVSGSLVITDVDTNQTHSSEILNDTLNGWVSLNGTSFEFSGYEGFKGREKFHILTVDDGIPQKGIISEIDVTISYNTAPSLAQTQRIMVEPDSTDFRIKLYETVDLEGDSLTYSIVDSPDKGSLVCTTVKSVFVCRYTPEKDFTGVVSFTYKASDGDMDSNISKVNLDVSSLKPFIAQISLNHHSSSNGSSCVLYNDGNVRCWGAYIPIGDAPSYYRERYLYTFIGDNEHPTEAPVINNFMEGGERVSKIAKANDVTCVLTVSGEVKCWGLDMFYILGKRNSDDNALLVEYAQDIDFGTSLKVVDIYARYNNVCAIFEGGRLKCWGKNTSGQLGLGHPYEPHHMKIPISEMEFVNVGERVRSMAIGDAHMCALLERGDVKCWGKISDNRLGRSFSDETNIGDDEHPSSIPHINLKEKAVQITAGNDFTCARLVSGKVRCWGQSSFGKLGLGNTTDNEGMVSLGEKAVDISSGDDHTCVLLASGKVRCWGRNIVAQLGNNDIHNSIGDDELPSSVDTLPLSKKVVDIESGRGFSCTLLVDGSLRCWGGNHHWGLGLGNNFASTIGLEHERSANTRIGGSEAALYPRFSFSPEIIVENTSIQFDSSSSHAKDTISTYLWDFGDGNTSSLVSPSHTYATSGDFTVSLTLTDSLGNTSVRNRNLKILSSNPEPFFPTDQSFAMEQDKTLAFDLEEAIDNDNSLTYSLVQLPEQGTLTDCLDGSDDLSCEYTPSIGFTGIVPFAYKASDGESDSIPHSTVNMEVYEKKPIVLEVSSFADHSCVLFSNKKIKCWGHNGSGQLGYGHTMDLGERDALETDFIDVGGDVLQVEVGLEHTCTLLTDGLIKCWGKGLYGALGSGDFRDITSPAEEIPFSVGFKVVQIAAGGNFTCALGEYGLVKCWGRNDSGQLGLGHTRGLGNNFDTRPASLEVVDLKARAVRIRAGNDHACAVLENDNLKCWGVNRDGKLGLGHTDNIGDDETLDTVANVSVGGGVSDVALTYGNTCALLTDGKVKCWGNGGYRNSLGRESQYQIDIMDPVGVTPLDIDGEVKKLSYSDSHVCVLLENRSMTCWGYSGNWSVFDYSSTNGHIVGYLPSNFFILDEGIGSMSSGSAGFNCTVSLFGNLRCWGLSFQDPIINRHGYPERYNIFSFVSNEAQLIDQGHMIIGRFSHLKGNEKRVVFDASDSKARNGVQSYEWNFGDGSFGTGVITSHTFHSSGSYTVSLTVKDSLNQTHTTTKKINIESDNLPPTIESNQILTIPQGRKIAIELSSALDFDSFNFTYSLFSSPKYGTLSDCLEMDNDLSCIYEAPDDFIGHVSFSYKASDGINESEASVVNIRIVEPEPTPVDIFSGHEGACVLYDNKKIKCWGDNRSDRFGYGHTDRIGDDELVKDQDFVNVGSGVIQVAIGFDHMCVLLEDGTVKCRGKDNFGQLGQKGISYSDLPSTPAIDLGTKVKQIAAYGNFTCALNDSGLVKCWGKNNHGQLGLGHSFYIGDDEDDSFSYIDLGAPVVKLAVGSNHSCALVAGGKVRCWGLNHYGQLGYGHKNSIGDNEHPSSAGDVSLDGDAVDVVVEVDYSCVLMADGKGKCWGRNWNRLLDGPYYLGDHLGDDELPSSVSKYINWGQGIERINVGSNHICGLYENKKIKCADGIFRNNINIDFTDQSFISFPDDILKMIVTGLNIYSLASSGKIYPLGRNYEGRLGLGHNLSIERLGFYPHIPLGGEYEPLMARFNYNLDESTLKVSFDASDSFVLNPSASYVWDFGDNSTGTGMTSDHTFKTSGEYIVSLTMTDGLNQSHTITKKIKVNDGNLPPSIERDQNWILPVSKKGSFDLLAAIDLDGDDISYGVVDKPTNGTLSACLDLPMSSSTSDLSCIYESPAMSGMDSFSYDANDGKIDSEEATVFVNHIESHSPPMRVFTGRSHSCILFKNKKIKCWGQNYAGQLGYDHNRNLGDDELFSVLDFVDVGENVLDVAVGDAFTCVLLDNQLIKCWGQDQYGQLGWRGQTYTDVASIPGIDLDMNVNQIISFGHFTCALSDMGKIKCWGYNNSGQLGLGHRHTIGDDEDEEISFMDLGTSAIKLVVGSDHACALLLGGKVRCWGLNNVGQLGYGHTNNIGDDEHLSSVGDVSVGGIVVDIGIGHNYTCVLLDDNTSKCWGESWNRYLGYPGQGNHIGDDELPSSISTVLDWGGSVDNIFVGYSHFCALFTNDKIKCWGENSYGELGINPLFPSLSELNTQPFVSLNDDGDILDMGLGEKRTFILFTSGKMHSWGFNRYGHLGRSHNRNVGFGSLDWDIRVSIGGDFEPVIARFDYDAGDTSFTFDASHSYGRFSSLKYSWDLGDGMTGIGESIQHKFDSSGTYTVTLTTTDTLGNTDSFTQSIKVEVDEE